MSPRILVVEDRQPNVEILQRLLAIHKFEVVVAGNKREACEFASSRDIDLILMDIHIPDDDGQPINDSGGLEATRIIKADQATAHIPVIATTASAMLDECAKLKEAGCDDVQSKPFEFGPLIDSINKLLVDRS